MTEAIAIPATSYILSRLLEQRIAHAYPGSNIGVSLAPPPRPPASPANGAVEAEKPGLILYMHHAALNTSWRNMYDPRTNAAGKRSRNAPLVVDLHYLLAATGADLLREAALGIGMSAFNRYGIVPRPKIEALLGGIAGNAAGASIHERIGAEPLALQPEQITITQQALDLDLSTKLWSALQSPLRPSAYYLATTVFLDPQDADAEERPVESVRVFGRPEADPDGPLTPEQLSYPEAVEP